MTREKYESLPLSTLKALAKSRNMKGISTLRKEALIERMLEEDQKENQKNMEEPTVLKEEKKTETVQDQNQEPQEKREDGMERQNRETSENGTARPYQRPRYVRREEHSENGERQEYRPRAPRFNERRFQEPRNYNQNNREEEQRQEPHQEAGQEMRQEPLRQEARPETRQEPRQETSTLDSGQEACGILEVMPDGFGFIRSDNYMPGDSDVYVSPSQIRRFGLKTGDIIRGNTRVKSATEKFSALLYLKSVNNLPLDQIMRRGNFEDMTPVFPDERLRLERPGGSMAMRIVDLVSPIGKGQRGMIVSPPKAGKTTLLKDAAKSILRNNPEMYLIILLIDERPEEVTDIKEAIQGSNVEVIYSTFDEQPEHHKRVSEMVIERAKRLVESKKDVTIFIDSITRLARAYNLTVPPSGRTLSGGLDPAALYMPKRFFGAARNMREGGSLTILATALVDTGSKMDDVVYEEFKGTGNMELVLDRKLQERRVFPAIDIAKSGTRREDLLLTPDEQEAVYNMRKALNGMKSEEAVENILNMFARTRNNGELIQILKKQKIV
ncbi:MULTISPECIES: transcription termination factor Rho [Lachnospiraceae]|jgi:transcription termination factor Rho|uniref:transcription termination factor Rho n=1 Tax=Lachnospiraceae TaxID=186803 RepID=UPI000E49DA6E|nr:MULTISPECIES: transcription termination factor Rho [Lachnospiraceae]NSD22106.1 transcription termination factor Rho [Fusicatenibacter saccharivorans]NSD79325.1 transcription termination factor Rho [Fusicatenibacter saccharivorans]RGH89129.1 transcription termination factor Rho [Blautia sp. AM28-36]RHS44838.1 transcription termination factor Rho [Blautia sp. AM47-4]RHT66025.1 transcription termination factor Rho [Blautia sp. AM28-27]